MWAPAAPPPRPSASSCLTQLQADVAAAVAAAASFIMACRWLVSGSLNGVFVGHLEGSQTRQTAAWHTAVQRLETWLNNRRGLRTCQLLANNGADYKCNLGLWCGVSKLNIWAPSAKWSTCLLTSGVHRGPAEVNPPPIIKCLSG